MNESLPSRFRRPSKPALPGMPKGWDAAAPVPLPKVEAGQHELDEFGLPRTAYADLSPLGRAWLARAYEWFGTVKTIAPTQQGMGTVPEMVLFGGLLEAGFTPGKRGPRGFLFQSAVLGGRATAGGGAVLDFSVHHNGRVVAVGVDSLFHAPNNPFGGRAKTVEDERQRLRTLTRGAVDVSITVNRFIDGHPLEHGPDQLVRADLQRVLHA